MKRAMQSARICAAILLAISIARADCEMEGVDNWKTTDGQSLLLYQNDKALCLIELDVYFCGLSGGFTNKAEIIFTGASIKRDSKIIIDGHVCDVSKAERVTLFKIEK
ncbi:MAG: hypothetical protein LBF86_06915 [Helicobacteraceae bacterium]|jgi:hypothetical protein|nr:hypothetical protein [Helicobacteraceae bacterium]